MIQKIEKNSVQPENLRLGWTQVPPLAKTYGRYNDPRNKDDSRITNVLGITRFSGRMSWWRI